ncbi:MAG: M20/M25/M40 family metallo-hydrolase [Acidobacteria bacterium]|nr:M20/M25/M40 family metallo-hydrolase [Acidobacteriota bacterium]
MRRRLLSVFTFSLFLAVGFGKAAISAPSQQLSSQLRQLAYEGIGLLREYLRINTTNPPGNEMEGVRFLSSVLRRENIPFEVFETAPGRANLYARLKGDGTRSALILLHHIDVVPAVPESWRFSPFSGTSSDGYLWGRGALDSKGLGIVHLMTFIAVKKSGLPLKRDLIFLATADEEAGGLLGVNAIIKSRPEWIRDAEYMLTEGGDNIVGPGNLIYLGVENAQKLPLWLRLVAKGQPGHGSIPAPYPAPEKLIRALQRLLNMEPQLKLSPQVADLFRHIAPFQPRKMREFFSQPESGLTDPEVVKRIPLHFRALLQNTISITVLRSGDKTNVIPQTAVAELDCRLLPDGDPQEFLEELRSTIADPEIEIQTLLWFAPASSSLKTPLFDAIKRAVSKLEPKAVVGPGVVAGFTDSYYFRRQGKTAYGLDPFKVRDRDSAGIHGNDERISIANIHFGIRFLYEVISPLLWR